MRGVSQCIETGCTSLVLTRDRCSAHYQRWRKSPDFTFKPRPEYAPPPDPECAWCGPYKMAPHHTPGICPTCGLDAAEIAYTERILADSAAVFAEEVRAYRAERRLAS